MSRLSPYLKHSTLNKRQHSPMTSQFQPPNKHADRNRYIRQTPVDPNKGKYYNDEIHTNYRPTQKKNVDHSHSAQIQALIDKNRQISSENGQLYDMLEQRGRIVAALQKKLQQQIYRQVTTLQAIQVEKNKFIVETQKKFKEYERKIEQLIKQIYILNQEKFQTNMTKAKEIDHLKQSLNKQQMIRLHGFANDQMTAREATEIEHNKVRRLLSVRNNQFDQLTFSYRNGIQKLKNQIITLNNEILHINHLRKIQLSQQKLQFQNMIDSIMKQSAKEKELIIVQHDIFVKKLEQQIANKIFENNKISQIKKINQIQQNVRETQLLDKKTKLEDEIKELEHFYKKKNFQESERLKQMTKTEAMAVSHGNEALIKNLRNEISNLVSLNQTKSQELKNLYDQIATLRNKNNEQVKDLQNFIESLKSKMRQMQRDHALEDQQLKIKWAQLSQANLVTLKQFYEHQLEVLSQQLMQKTNLADSNRQKLHHELQDKNQMRKRFDLQNLKLNTRITQLQLQVNQLIVAKKEQTSSLSSNMLVTSQKLVQNARDRQKLSATNEQDKKKLQELILAKDKQIQELNIKIRFLRQNYSNQIAQKNSELEIVKKQKQDVENQLKKQKLFYEAELKRKDAAFKESKNTYEDQHSRLKGSFRKQYDDMAQDLSSRINKLELQLKQMQAIQKNLKSQLVSLIQNQETEITQKQNQLLNEKDRMNREKKSNQSRLNKFYKEEIEKLTSEIEDLRKQLRYKEEDIRRMAEQYNFLQQKMNSVIQSQDKLRSIQNKILNLGQQNNLVKNFAEIVKSKQIQ